MGFKKYILEKEENIFPSDVKIDSIIEDANEAFWNVIIEAFKNKLDSKDFNGEGLSKVLETLKQSQKEAVKEWLKSNWTDINNVKKDDKPKINASNMMSKFPAFNKSATDEVRI